MQKVYSVIWKIGLAKTYYVWICSNRYLGFLTLCVDTSIAFILCCIMLNRCIDLQMLVSAVLKESMGGRPFLCAKSFNAALNEANIRFEMYAFLWGGKRGNPFSRKYNKVFEKSCNGSEWTVSIVQPKDVDYNLKLNGYVLNISK